MDGSEALCIEVVMKQPVGHRTYPKVAPRVHLGHGRYQLGAADASLVIFNGNGQFAYL